MMFFNSMFFAPFIPPNCDKPPTVYAVLNSIVNGDKEIDDEQVKIKDLAKEGRSKIFDFYYPLTDNMDKEYFETMILNHYMTRRIGFQTVTSFKLHLNSKLNTIMPKYNVLFDNYAQIMNGNTITKNGNDNQESSTNQSTQNSNESNSRTENKYSDTPEGRLNDVQNDTYLTDYTLTNADVSSNGSSSANGTGTNQRQYNETITEKNINENYIKLQYEMNHVFEMIFKDLDSLFFSVV